MKKISMDIPMSMYRFYKESKRYNMTDVFRTETQRLMDEVHRKMSPLFFMASIFGIVFAVVLISIGLSPTPIDVTVKGVLALLGGFLALSTGMLYYKERKAISV